ncbi:MAG: bifunctional DNA-formamidopyrimidine glycosylase/DNA-(apurinic or apyrimidinic site) lyase [Solirubrobacterales bacterium]|nr:bifunctional DNA-formamidopyrimidine glycosylase/DNA-(apurinic or apyrimidinic site) lyase [Solirubrobacterales bacterium]MBV9472869.1 bifunctional DNA-formamidopyrimidine glycosylase/DNA-(apurinic or apyrimidinic site) lyase [Solirubrobacterales bacterium]MBV9838500.1 bifunctional DNA-formamidopyrimidine glycosylase/DNA-(apurinic or apyrimidinic site) lyase [Solirubrobacterales bacterium]
MPELPEVETIRRQLAPHLEGRTILGVEILDPRWTRPHPPRAVEAGLRSRTVERLTRSGKYLVIGLSGGSYLLIHLRMTGALLLDPAQEPRHTRVRFELDAGHRLVYIDPRRFGTGHLLPDERARDAYLAARIGIEPLSPEFTTERLRLLARGRRAPVKAFLLDQRRVAGVGNIYADEALFRAKIHPLRAAGSLTRPQLARLRDAVEQALQAGIEAKGASIDDFRHIDGARGAFQDRFLIHLRAGEPCVRCGAIVRKIVVGGRGTYVCERCQRKPRPRLAPAGPGAPRAPRGG